MIVELNLSNIIFLAIACTGGLWALMKVIATQYRNAVKRELGEHFRVQDVTSAAQYDKLNTRLDTLDASAKLDTGQWQRVERELLMMKADMPMHYVRREDYVQAVASILVKLDAAQMRHENLLLKGLRHD